MNRLVQSCLILASLSLSLHAQEMGGRGDHLSPGPFVPCPLDFKVIAPGTFVGNTTGGLDDCDVFGSDGEDHIYKVRLPVGGEWTFALCGSSYDTKIEVGTSCCGSDIGTNDDSCGLQSSITAMLPAGIYFVTVDGFGGQTGDYVLDISNPAICTADFLVEAPGVFAENTSGAGADCDVFGSDGEDHIYEVLVPVDGEWTFALCGSSYDTKIEVGTTCCSSDIASNDDSCGLQSSVTVDLTEGTYYVTVDGFGGQTGDYVLDISSPGICATDFLVEAPGIFAGNTAGAGDDCDVFGSDGEDHTYEVTLPVEGLWTFALCGSSFDTKIEVGTNCCGSDIGTNDDSCALQSSVSALLGAGTYFVTVDGFGGQTGAYMLDISFSGCGEDFAVGAPGTFLGNTTGAVNDCDVFGSDGEDHLYRVTLPNGGDWTFALCGSSFDTKIEVGTDCCDDSIGTNDDSCGLQSIVTSTLAAGDYFVTVDGFGGQTGAYTLEVAEATPAPGGADLPTLDLRAELNPNLFTPGADGVLELGLMGSPIFDAAQVDPATLQLARYDGTGSAITPYDGTSGPQSGLWLFAKPEDVLTDFVVPFRTADMTAALKLSEIPVGMAVQLVLTGSLLDGTPFKAIDSLMVTSLKPEADESIITVTSDSDGVWVDATVDAHQDGGGFAPFLRCYPIGATIELSATQLPGNSFARWSVNGEPQPMGEATVTVVMEADTTLEVIYD